MKKQKDIIKELLRTEFKLWDRKGALKKAGVVIETLEDFTLIDIAFDAMGFPSNSGQYDRFKIYTTCIDHYHRDGLVDICDLVERLYSELDSLMLQKPEFFSAAR